MGLRVDLSYRKTRKEGLFKYMGETAGVFSTTADGIVVDGLSEDELTEGSKKNSSECKCPMITTAITS